MNGPDEPTQPNPATAPREAAATRRTPTIVALVAGAAAGIAIAGGLSWAALQDDTGSTAQPASGASTATASAPAPATTADTDAATNASTAPREDCSVYLAEARRDNGKVVKDGAVGAMIGAGTGAAGGAIADGGDGAGKGAGIGAVVGAVAGAVHSLSGENERVGAAERAYRACLARND